MGRMRLYLIAVLVLLSKLVAAQETRLINTDASIEIRGADKINSRHLEFGPMYYGGGIIFVHAKDQDKFIDKAIGTPYFEIMYSDLGPDGLPIKSYSFSSNIRTKFHEGPSSFSPDYSRIYFTRSNYLDGREIAGADGKAHMKIYTAYKGAEDWEDISELPFCSDDYDNWGPAVSPDGQSMVFVSNRPGGFGEMDLYLTHMENGSWSEPVNLGPGINTSESEAFPFWHPSGVLFFSTRGRKDGIGKLDIYAVRIDDTGITSEVELLPEPINSKYDDLTFICDSKGARGFFASSRKGGEGKDDIYSFSADPGIFNFDPEEFLTIMHNIRVLDAETGNPVEGASVWCLPLNAQGIPDYDGTVIRREVNTADGGKKVMLEVSTQGRVEVIDPVFRTTGTGESVVHFTKGTDYIIWAVAPTYEDEKETYKATMEAKRAGEDITIFLTPSDLLARHKQNAMTGDEVDCIPLTALVLDRENGKPIAGARVTLRDTCMNLTRIFATDSLGVYTDCLRPGCVYQVEIAADDYANRYVDLVPDPERAGSTFFLERLGLEDRAESLKEGDLVLLRNIYYDFNKSAIRKSDTDELDALARIMLDRPEMRIELRSHTDSRGTDAYNLELSERRAVSAMEFLVSRGVDPSRIELKPMGESELINKCSDGVECTDAEHQENRRTEFVVLRMGPASNQ